MIVDPLFAKQDAHRRLKAMLYQWRIPHRGVRNDHFHYVAQVGRFHVYPYWRPMTRDRFERLTLDYLGPYIPFVGSEREYIDDDFIVGEFFDQKYTHHHYQRVHPYFYCPAFVLTNEWPHERSWNWTPCVRITPKIMRNALLKEVVYGGWPKNSRGRIRVPYRTGATALSRTVTDGQGWARYTPEGLAGLSLDREREGDCDLYADLSVSGRGWATTHDPGQRQDDLFGHDAQENPV